MRSPVRSAELPLTTARLDGYRHAVAAHRGQTARLRVWEAPGNSVDAGAAAASMLLQASPCPTAVLCMSDQLALGVLQAAAHHPVRVPERLSVIGFDDAPPAALAGLTTVAQPLVPKGRLAARLLLAQLDRDARPPEQPDLLPTTLVVRATSASPAHVA